MTMDSTFNPAGPGGAELQVTWTEHQAECLETALSESAFALGHMASVCHLLWEVVSSCSPRATPRGVESVLYMSFLAMDAMSNREADLLHDAEFHIRDARMRAVKEREEAARERAAAKADMEAWAKGWAAQGNRNPDEKEAAE